ncbi:MAG TPA: VTT domain-containing protein [Bacillota bacterium]|nr:VTT domain-containing protein [Bacillota bacterium]
MELFETHVINFLVETGSIFAPVLFISFHLLRPLFFLPVVVICISGGMIFGTVAGTIYSIIGITLSSIFFYGIIHWMPKSFHKLTNLREKWLGKQLILTPSQIALLRLVPFIHFHLLSLYLIEISNGFKDYTKASLLTNIPLAVVYTSFGQHLSGFSPLTVMLFLVILFVCIHIFRHQEVILKWNDFFQTST